MFYYYRSGRRYLRVYYRFFYILIIIISFIILWFIFRTLNSTTTNDNQIDRQRSPKIFCFVLSANSHHLTYARSIIYTWGKRCDRFYFITRLQESSTELMMLPKFENITDVTETTINRLTYDVLLHLRNEEFASSYHWFLRGSDESFVILPNLRRLLSGLEETEIDHPFAYVSDAAHLYNEHQISITGSVMLFNRHALDRLVSFQSLDNAQKQCFKDMIYDHEFVKCMKQIDIDINFDDENLILSQSLAEYRMNKRLKGTCCNANTVAFRAINETDMYKFEFLYHHLDAISKIDP